MRPFPSSSLDAALSLSFPEPESEGAEDAELVRQALAGRGAGFDAIVRRHGPRVFRYLLQLARHREDAEDLTQQTFLKAYRHLAAFDTSHSLIAWLLTIGRRTALNHFRDSRRWEPLTDREAAPAAAPDAAAEARDLRENLWDRARARLSAREFEVLWLRFGEGLSTQETARVLGLTQPHVKIIVYRAKQALTKGMKP